VKTFATKGATEILYAEDFRSNGCPNVWLLKNESRSIELDALFEEVESAIQELEIEVDSDVTSDAVMASMIGQLNSTPVLDASV